MKTTLRLLTLTTWSAAVGLCTNGFSQTAVAPTTVPTPGVAPGATMITPLGPQQPLQSIQTNPSAAGAMSASPRAATTFQMQTPGGGAPAQAGNLIPPRNQPNMMQPNQQSVSPTQ